MSDTVQQVGVMTSCRICGQAMTVYCDPPVNPENLKEAEWREKLAKLAAHDKCVDGKLASERAARLSGALIEKAKKWQTLCPPEFQKELDWSNRRCRRDRFDRIMAWRYGAKGMFIYGPTRTCKTRFAWKLMGREHITGNRSISAVTHADVRLAFSRLAKDDVDKLDKYITHLSNVDLLFIDDLGKGYVTEASESSLWMVVEARCSYGRPMIITSNDDIEALRNRFSEERGKALLRRIEDHCDLLGFK